MNHAVRISDGLGNQMFQYAFAYALNKKTGDSVLIDPLFWGTSLRKYKLNEYSISNTDRMISEGLDYILGFGPRNGRKFKNSYRERIVRQKYSLINEKEIMKYDPDMFKPSENSFYLGFWQSPLYFDDYRAEIKKEFTRSTPLSEKASRYIQEVRQENSVSLHIRRTDYVRDTGNVALTMPFYEKALERLDKELGDYKLYVFTDDKEFVASSFHLKNYILVEDLSDVDDLEVMKNCKHHVIANSTFSWWAAYLGDDNAMTIAPKVGIWGKDYYPSSWRILDAEV